MQVSGIRSGKGFKELVTADNAEFNYKLHLAGAGDGPSDHATFFHKNIPVLFFSNGLHADYHRPTDTWEKINAPVAADTARLAAKILLDLANRPERAVFTPAGSGVMMGISADREKEQSAKGYPVGGVLEGSPAENAGLQSGDLIVELNGQALTSALDLLMSLTEFSPGDVADLKVRRGERTLTAKVTLAPRGQKKL
jgi:C-terminal processing protease CtpA/Prc